MADRRAIKSCIWDDEFFGELSVLSQLVWIGLFSRMADDQGRLLDNAPLISSRLFPYKNVSPGEIEACLNDFGDHIIRYERDGKRYIQIAKWWENQPLQYAVPSCFPAPDGWTDRYRTSYKGTSITYNWETMQNSEAGTLLYNKLAILGRVSRWGDYVEALNSNTNTNTNTNSNTNSYPNSDSNSNPKKDQKESAAAVTDCYQMLPEATPDMEADKKPAAAALSDQNFGKVARVYEQEIGVISPMISDQIGLWIDTYPIDWITDAIKESVKHNARNSKYTDKILQRWMSQGRGSPNNQPGAEPGKPPDPRKAALQEWRDEIAARERASQSQGSV